MELSDYLRVARRRWVTICTLTLGGLVVAGLFSFLAAPTYTARTQLFVAIQNVGSVSELQQGNTFTQARVASYVQTVTTPAVLQPAIESLGLNTTSEYLAQKVTASSDRNTVLITITASAASPVEAAAIAGAVADSLVATVDSLERPADGVSPVKLSIVTPAAAPIEPSGPNVQLNLALGLALGFAVGVGLALLRTALDTKLRGEQDVRRATQAPLLGGIAYTSDAIKRPLITQIEHQSPRAESFRQLRTNLQFAHVSKESKTVLVTSSVPGEGKSTTAINMAIALAQAGNSVALVDADLRRPMVSEYLGLERNAGLTTALVGQAQLDDLLQPWGEDRLFVLTSGLVPPNPSELLGSPAMDSLLDHLESVFDVVIVDAPPLLPVTDAAVLAQKVGGVVLVVGSSKAKLPELQRSLGTLEMVKADLLGVVVNFLPVKGPDAYSYSYYSSDVASSPKNTKPSSSKVPERRSRRLQKSNAQLR